MKIRVVAFSWRLLAALGLAAWFLVELIGSSLQVAWDVLTPRHRARPGVIAVPLDARSDAEIALVAALISLTPGSLALDVSPDRRTLFVHVMFVRDPDRERQSIKDGPERHVLRVFRGRAVRKGAAPC